MLQALTLFLICQLFGEFFVRVTFIQLPGPLIGMFLLLLILFLLSKSKRFAGARNTDSAHSSSIDRAANGILANLSLLFVPAAVGIIQHLPLIADHTTGLVIAILGSTLLTLLVSVGVFRMLSSRPGVRQHGDK